MFIVEHLENTGKCKEKVNTDLYSQHPNINC